MLNDCGNFFSRGGFGMMMPMGWIWLLLLLAAGLLLWRAFTKPQQNDRILPDESQSTETAHDILLKEYAKGNITEEDYLTKKKYMD